MTEPADESTAALTDFVDVSYRLGDQYAVHARAWRYCLKLVMFVIGVYAVVTLFGIYPIFTGFSLDAWVVFAVALIVGVMHFGLSPLLSQFRARKLTRRGGVRMRLTVEGVDIRTAQIDSLVRWSAIKRVARSRDRLMLFISDCSAFVLVRGRMIDDDGFATWERIARDHAGRQSA